MLDWSGLLQTYSIWDLAIFGVLIAGSLVYAFLVGHGRLIAVLVATYMSFVLIQAVPFFSPEEFEFRLGAFVIVFFLILFMLMPVVFESPVGVETFGILLSLVLALAQTGFFAAVLVSFLPEEITARLSSITQTLFVGDTAFFVWALIPVVILLLVGRKINQEY
jgi:hypothetical protein